MVISGLWVAISLHGRLARGLMLLIRHTRMEDYPARLLF
jgi:hypothetical protein